MFKAKVKVKVKVKGKGLNLRVEVTSGKVLLAELLYRPAEGAERS